MKNSSIMLLPIILTIVFAGCSSFEPIPLQDRFGVTITNLTDLTSDYSTIDPKFEDVVALKLKDDFAFDIEPSISYGGAKTTYITNHFKYLPQDFAEMADITIEGTVDQVHYGSPNDISAYIEEVNSWGIFGLIHREQYELNHRSALLEYRITVRAGDRILDTFLVQGVYEADVKKLDRPGIIQMAIKVAAEELVFALNKHFSKTLGFKPKCRIYAGVTTNIYPLGLWNELSKSE